LHGWIVSRAFQRRNDKTMQPFNQLEVFVL
jgi:hypothetical protein